MDGFEQLLSTPAEREALERLRAATNSVNGPMERHCLRVRRIAAQLAEHRGWRYDEELLSVAAILHDIGLYPGVTHGGVYTKEGADLARSLLAAHGWPRTRIERCADAIDRHHELRRQRGWGNEVEALRLADLIDLTGGRLRLGLDRAWMAELQRSVPRDGLAGELAREIGTALRQRPLTMAQIFVRGT